MDSQPTDIARGYAAERAAYIPLFTAIFAAFLAQIVIRARSIGGGGGKTPIALAQVFDYNNAKCVNQLCGALSALWAVFAWIDIHTAFDVGPPAIFTFSFVASWSTLANAFVINASIAIRTMISAGCLDQPQTYRERVLLNAWLWGCLASPWVFAISSVISMAALNRSWPLSMWTISSSLVFLATMLQIVYIRMRIASYVAKIANTRNATMARWKRFTHMSAALAFLIILVAAADGYLLFSGDLNRTFKHSNPANYTGAEAVEPIAAGVQVALLLSMLWFSWVPPRSKDFRSSGDTSEGNSVALRYTKSVRAVGEQLEEGTSEERSVQKESS